MRRLLAGLLGLALPSAPGAFAQSPPGPAAVELPPVTVPLPPEERPDSITRRDSTGSVTVIDAAAQAGRVRDAAELVGTAPGVVVQDSGGLGQSKALLIRGAPSTGALVLLDGVPMNGAGGLADLSLFPLAALERIEVLRGGAGARYGSGGLGGVVNLVTPELTGTARAQAELLAGSFWTTGARLSAQGPLWGGSALLVAHGFRTAGDFPYRFDDRPEDPASPLVSDRRRNNDASSGGGLLKDRRLLGAWTLASVLEGNAVDRGIAGSLGDPTQDEREQAQRGSLSTRLARTFDSGLELSLRAFGRVERHVWSGGLYRRPLPQTLAATGASVDASWLLGGVHALSVVGEAGYEGLTGEPAARWGRGAAMAIDEVLLADGTLVLAPSVRFELQGPFATVSPKLGASWALPAGLGLEANLALAQRAPSFLELYVQQGALAPNPDLHPERALTADLALSFRRGGQSATATGFISRYQELIVYELVPPLKARPVNVGQALAAGLELEGQGAVSTWLSWAGAYTLLHSENLDPDPRFFRRALPNRPTHRLHAELTAGPRVLHARAELDLQSVLSINRTGTLQLPGRGFVHLALASAFGEGSEWLLTAELKNLFDVQAQDVNGYPLPGRALFLGVQYALDPAHLPQSHPKATP